MAKLVTCLTVLLSFGICQSGSMLLEDRSDDVDEVPEDIGDSMLLSAPSRVAEEVLRRGEWEGGESPIVSVAKRVPRPPPYLSEEEVEAATPQEPALDADDLLRAAVAIQAQKAKEEEEARELEEAMRRPRRLDTSISRSSQARAVTPDELRQLLGENPRRKKSAPAPRKATLLRQYLQSALNGQEEAAKKRKRAIQDAEESEEREAEEKRKKRAEERRKRVVKRGAQAPSEEEESPKTPREAFLRDLLVSNALLNAENSYLTDALNAATVAQTNGNRRTTLRREMAGIENAEKIEAVLEQLKHDQQQLDTAQVPEDVAETVVVTDNSIANLKECPAVKELSTGCKAVIKAYEFVMDQDAIDACDAHNVCYGCSASMESSRELCDQVFMVQSENLCMKENNRRQCVVEAKNLLEAMQNVHEKQFATARQREKMCRNPCVNAFFSVVYRPPR